MAGILVQPCNITDVIQFISPKQEETELWKQLNFFPKKITLPFPSSQDLATQAAADLTHALLYPQPAGPFCQVSNEQTIALKRLASIFDSAKQRKTKSILINKFLSSQTNHYNQHLIHIAGKKHLTDV
jgi:hypothetical protein